MGAVVAKGDNAIRTFADCNTLSRNDCQHHLPLGKFSDIANGTRPTVECALLPLSGIGITAIDADLVAVCERATQPSGITQHSNSDCGKQYRQISWPRSRSATNC